MVGRGVRREMSVGTEMKKSRKGIAVIACALALAAGGSIAVATTTGGGMTPRLTAVAGAGEVVLVPPRNAGVGGWCLTELGGPEGGKTGGECRANERSIVGGPFQGPIIAESGNRFAVIKGVSSPVVMRVVALTAAPVAAVSFKGHKRIATHASALLPDHLRGAIVELRGRASGHPLRFPRFPRGHLIAWSRSGKPIPQTFASGPPLTFGTPVSSWSNGASARRGVCDISASGVAGLEQRSGSVVSEITPHVDVLGREFLNCAQSSYLLNGKWPFEAYVLLDAAHPGTTPAPLPGMRSLAGHRGLFIGPGPESGELARRISGAWLLVSAGEDTAQRLTLVEHLHATLHLR
jgi:hypothetical protein